MGLLDALMGNASDMPVERVREDPAPLLLPDETVERAFVLVRDLMVFTDRRLIMVNKQGLTGSKVETVCVPWRSVVFFSIENAGTFDMESELKLWISGQAQPMQRTFGRKVDTRALLGLLSRHVLR